MTASPSRSVRRLIPLLPALLTLSCGVTDPSGTKTSVETITVEGNLRSYRLRVPEVPRRPAPLILVFHGFGIDAARMEEHTGLSDAAEAAGVLVAYLESAEGAWDIEGELERRGIDDIEFTHQVIGQLNGDHELDRDRIYAVGLSNGGAFVQRLGCALSDSLAGIVSVVATLPLSVEDYCSFGKGLPDPRPLNALVFLGTEDTYFPIEGTTYQQSADGTLDFWAQRVGCTGVRSSQALPDTAQDGTLAYRSLYAGCPSQFVVRLDSIVGAGHGWPGARDPFNPSVVGVTSRNLSANQEILSFVLR